MTKSKHKIKIKFKIKKKELQIASAVVISILIPLVVFFGFYFGKIYPGVNAAGIDLSGKTPEEAIKILSSITPPSKITLTTNSGAEYKSFNIPMDSAGLTYDYNSTANAAFKFGRTGNFVYDGSQIFKSMLNGKALGIRFSVNEEVLATNIFTIAGQVGLDPVYPSAKLSSGKVVIEKGKKGTDLDANNLRLLIGINLAYARNNPIEIPVEEIDPTLNSFEEAAFSKRAEIISTKVLHLKFDDKSLQYSGDDLLSIINPKGGYDSLKVSELSREVATLINRAPQEAKFVFDTNQKRVNTFQPSKDGIRVNQDELSNQISEILTKSETDQNKEIVLIIPASTSSPIVQTGDVNNLGIKELIGRGTSIFRGSIPSRVFNVNLAATRVSGTLIAPGETFSFNNSVGDISELSGYQKAYIIQNGKTILGDGGGVCQVSTTLFRAAMDAGLPIVDRSPHAYRVYYYEQDAPPGFDATVYSPTVDFKFKNDTQNYILIQAYPNPKNFALTFELYGTKDGRVAEVGKPVITSTTPPPDDSYQDDPTLPAGTTKQTEHRALGTNLYFVYKVTKNGQTTFQKTFYSNYRPWGNVFLRGTGV